jgi:predicted MFS family arabinose efflux permease
MRSLVVLAFLLTALAFPMISFLPVFAKDVFHGGPDVYMWFLVATGAGSVTGALMVAAAKRSANPFRTALMAMVVLGALIAGFGLSSNRPLSTALLFGGGAAMMIVFALNTSLVQAYVGDAMRGRVMSVYNVAFRGGMPMGSLLNGFLIKSMSAPMVMSLNGVLLGVLGIGFLLGHRSKPAESEAQRSAPSVGRRS